MLETDRRIINSCKRVFVSFTLPSQFGFFQHSQQWFHINSETYPAFLKYVSHQPTYSYKMPFPTVLKGHKYITILILSYFHLANFLFFEKGIPCSWADSIEQTLLMLLWTWSSWNVFSAASPNLFSSQHGCIPLELSQKEKKKHLCCKGAIFHPCAIEVRPKGAFLRHIPYSTGFPTWSLK